MGKRRFALLLILLILLSGHSLYGQANAAAPQAAGQTSQSGETPHNNSVQMLTPNEGVDFTAYLNRVLSTVKRNWFAVIPESAQMGEKGRVVLRFSILRNGKVPDAEPVLESTSSKEPLDRAALASIRASSPFEPLPIAFKGEQIELRAIFLYNLAPNAAPGALPPPSPANLPPGGVTGGVIGGVPGGLASGISSSPPPPPPPPPSDTSKSGPHRIRLGGRFMQEHKLVKMVAPKYPALAAQARIAGTVRLQLIVAKDGTVSQLEVQFGHPLLIQAALDAVKQWQYQPTLLNGEAVEVVTTVDVVFTLYKKPSKKD